MNTAPGTEMHFDNAGIVWKRFDPLWNDIDEKDEFYSLKPHLAHYTSIAGIEGILESNELWFANPLYMNDHEEVRFGINQAMAAVTRSESIERALGTRELFTVFRSAFDACFRRFANEHVIDTYVFCMSQHEPSDNDGLLSMWRGYGGNGRGVALVFDTANIAPIDHSALVLARVQYGSTEVRLNWLNAKIDQFASLLATRALHQDHVQIAAKSLFDRLHLAALFSKHKGFEEEREWRVVYMPDRDTTGALKKQLSYVVGSRGIEPRLKFKIAPVEGVTPAELSLNKLTQRIILGPTISSPLAATAFYRLLDQTGHPELKPRVRSSGIPFRDRL
jgi:hypothetical protein